MAAIPADKLLSSLNNCEKYFSTSIRLPELSKMQKRQNECTNQFKKNVQFNLIEIDLKRNTNRHAFLFSYLVFPFSICFFPSRTKNKKN